MAPTYTFVFNPEPEGGFTVTCPALPGLVTYGETLDEARAMALDAMQGLIEVMIEQGEPIPGSDSPDAVARFHQLAHTLQEEGAPEPVFEQLSPKARRDGVNRIPSLRPRQVLAALERCAFRLFGSSAVTISCSMPVPGGTRLCHITIAIFRAGPFPRSSSRPV
jgi:predicted RNase H-like HicB family nuclease